MEVAKNILKELWAKQQIAGADIDYNLWQKNRISLLHMAEMSRSCIFTVDVYRGVYDYASDMFEDIFGIDQSILRNIDRQGDVIQERIHPDDRKTLLDLQIRHSRFIYSLPPEERNDFRTIYQCRMRNKEGLYVNITSRQQVLETDRKGKAWIIMGIIELSSDQTPADRVKCAVLNLKTGKFFNPYAAAMEQALTERELEILSLIRQGYLSKEIASNLGISIHTVNNHRKKILEKLNADNAMEAVAIARGAGLLS